MSAIALDAVHVPATGWSSRAGFVLACAGSAVGLGNLWKFPYIVGEHGGGAFVLVYLACIALVALPILVAEVLAGRLGGPDPVQAMSSLTTPPGSLGRWVGRGVVFTAAVVLAMYGAVAGWAVAYTGLGFSGAFGAGGPTAAVHFDALLADPLRLLVCYTVFLGMTAAIVSAGIQRGIERHLRWMMLGLFALLVAMVIHVAMTSGQFERTARYLLMPRWDTLSPAGVIEAVGHAFYSLSVGLGGMLAYGAYTGARMPLGRMALTVAGIDTLTALLAAFVIFPIVFAAGMNPGAGPGLLFITLPDAFAKMPGGQWLLTIFFVFVVLAALTSAVSLLEPLASAFGRWARTGRRASVLTCIGGIWLLGLACVFSTNYWSEVKLFDLSLLDLFDTATSGLLLPLCGAGIALAVGWSVSDNRLRAALFDVSPRVFAVWRWLIRGLAPGAVLLLLFWRWLL